MTRPIYQTEQIRQWENRWFMQGNSSYGLMQQAAWSVSQWVMQHYPLQSVAVCCGGGNNGGDGWLIAAYLHQAGWPVQICNLTHGRAPERRRAEAYARECRVPVWRERERLPVVGLLIDALFGIGLNRAPEGEAATWIHLINQAAAQVLAVDLPSGVQSDTGHVWQGCAVRADHTLCLLALKSGLVTGEAKNYLGQVHVLSLIPLEPSLTAFAQHHSEVPRLSPRRNNSHKGSHGHALLIGGGLNMGGAVLLAAEAARRSGAGKVILLTHVSHLSAALARDPQVMSHGIAELGESLAQQLQDLMPNMTSVAIGMGLGRGAWGRAVWQALLPYLLDAESLAAVVVDADALYHLRDTDPSVFVCNNAHWHCTPHVGEAARLLDCSTHDIEADRYAAIQQLHLRYGGQWVLKGAGSVVLDQSSMTVCGLGNAGMAVGGMGDVLAGMAAGLRAQFETLPLIDIVCLHAAAGDLAAKNGQRGMTALDVVNCVQQVLNAD